MLEQRAARIPECPAMLLEFFRGEDRIVDGRFGESEAIDQAMEAVGVLRAVGQADAPRLDLATTFRYREGPRSGPRRE